MGIGRRTYFGKEYDLVLIVGCRAHLHSLCSPSHIMIDVIYWLDYWIIGLESHLSPPYSCLLFCWHEGMSNWSGSFSWFVEKLDLYGASSNARLTITCPDWEDFMEIRQGNIWWVHIQETRSPAHFIVPTLTRNGHGMLYLTTGPINFNGLAEHDWQNLTSIRAFLLPMQLGKRRRNCWGILIFLPNANHNCINIKLLLLIMVELFEFLPELVKGWSWRFLQFSP